MTAAVSTQRMYDSIPTSPNNTRAVLNGWRVNHLGLERLRHQATAAARTVSTGGVYDRVGAWCVLAYAVLNDRVNHCIGE